MVKPIPEGLHTITTLPSAAPSTARAGVIVWRPSGDGLDHHAPPGCNERDFLRKRNY